MNFVREWFENCHVNNYFCLEDGAGENQDDVFVEHRFDQSVFSCLYKKYDFDRYPDESWWGPEWQTLGQDFPIWAMRNRTGKDPFKVTSRTVLDELYPKSKFTLNLADKYLT